MTHWTVIPVAVNTLQSAPVLAEALNEVERAGWTVIDVIGLEDGLGIVACQDDSPLAGGQTALKLTPRQRMKAAGVPGLR